MFLLFLCISLHKNIKTSNKYLKQHTTDNPSHVPYWTCLSRAQVARFFIRSPEGVISGFLHGPRRCDEDDRRHQVTGAFWMANLGWPTTQIRHRPGHESPVIYLYGHDDDAAAAICSNQKLSLSWVVCCHYCIQHRYHYSISRMINCWEDLLDSHVSPPSMSMSLAICP